MPDATDVIQLTDEINKKNSTKNVEPDIAAFVESQIEQHSHMELSECSLNLLELIKQALISGAQGMYVGH